MAEPWLHSGMRLKIEQIKDLLDKLPLASSVSITRPAELAKELFTHKGSGTLIRRGERVDVHTDWSRLDQARLRDADRSEFPAAGSRPTISNARGSTRPTSARTIARR